MKKDCETCTSRIVAELVEQMVVKETPKWNGKERRKTERRKIES